MLDATDLDRIRDIIKEEIEKIEKSPSTDKTKKKEVKNEL